MGEQRVRNGDDERCSCCLGRSLARLVTPSPMFRPRSLFLAHGSIVAASDDARRRGISHGGGHSGEHRPRSAGMLSPARPWSREETRRERESSSSTQREEREERERGGGVGCSLGGLRCVNAAFYIINIKARARASPRGNRPAVRRSPSRTPPRPSRRRSCGPSGSPSRDR